MEKLPSRDCSSWRHLRMPLYDQDRISWLWLSFVLCDSYSGPVHLSVISMASLNVATPYAHEFCLESMTGEATFRMNEDD